MKKKIFYLSIIFSIFFIIFLSAKSSRFTGINYTIIEEKISNFEKILDFYERDNNYEELVQRINKDTISKKDAILNISRWVYFNINKISDKDQIIDSHPWTIIERKLGAKDQFSDILSVLLVYNNTSSFFISKFNKIGNPLTFFKHNKDWSLIDPYYGIYFLNKKNEFCNLKNLKNKNCFFYHLKYGEIEENQLAEIFYDKNFVSFKDLNNYYNFLFEDMPKSKDIANTNIYERGGRSYIQKPFHRLIYQMQNLIN